MGRPQPPAPQGVVPLDPLDRARHRVATLSRLSRELLILAAALFAGIVLVPLLIWLVGNRVLGPYTHGTDTHAGPMALLGDFLSGLRQGFTANWVIALGPAFLVVLLRLMVGLLRPREGDAGHPE